MRVLGVVLLLTFACSVNAALKAEIAIPNDPRFALNSCIVVGEFTDPDCNRVASLFESNEACAPFDENSTQIIFKSIEDAIRCCPFDPVMIETIGVIYLNDHIIYSQPHDIIIRGTSVGNFHSTLVNAHNIQIKHSGVNLQVSNLIFEGCGIDESLFASPTHEYEKCLIDQSLSFDGCAIQNYSSPIVICQIGLKTNTTFWLTNSVIIDIPSTAIMVSDTQSCNIFKNTFFNCGNAKFSCFEIINTRDVLIFAENEYFFSNESD